MEDIHYKTEPVKLEPGDGIILFNDGATQIQNAGKGWLGADGFIQILLDPDYPKPRLAWILR
jgi:serine phosphatase RsbU (regulator of sigma subunit)